MRVHVYSSLGDLSRDLTSASATVKRKAPAVVAKNAKRGNRLAQGFARAESGPHGAAYFKRLSAEAITSLSWEYGPTGVVSGNAVGGGWRNGAGNTDLPKSADVIGPKFAKDAGDLLDGLL